MKNIATEQFANQVLRMEAQESRNDGVAFYHFRILWHNMLYNELRRALLLKAIKQIFKTCIKNQRSVKLCEQFMLLETHNSLKLGAAKYLCTKGKKNDI